jgi:hypothetical protein
MCKVARLRACALDDFGVLHQNGIELIDQRHDLCREVAIEVLHFAAAYLAERGMQLAQGCQSDKTWTSAAITRPPPSTPSASHSAPLKRLTGSVIRLSSAAAIRRKLRGLPSGVSSMRTLRSTMPSILPSGPMIGAGGFRRRLACPAASVST